MSAWIVCPKCRGSWLLGAFACSVCLGRGWVKLASGTNGS